jgi:hypothetical protein
MKHKTAGKARITVTITGKLIPYLEHLHSTGLYGNTLQDTARHLIASSIQSRIKDGLIEPMHCGHNQAVHRPSQIAPRSANYIYRRLFDSSLPLKPKV